MISVFISKVGSWVVVNKDVLDSVGPKHDVNGME